MIIYRLLQIPITLLIAGAMAIHFILAVPVKWICTGKGLIDCELTEKLNELMDILTGVNK